MILNGCRRLCGSFFDWIEDIVGFKDRNEHFNKKKLLCNQTDHNYLNDLIILYHIKNE